MKKLRIFYVHGMGGGLDSRIPSLLGEYFRDRVLRDSEGNEYAVEVHVRTYSFDPDLAFGQISEWVEELRPDMVIGESLGANHAMAVATDVPHLYVSPAMNAPLYISRLWWMAYLPGMTRFLNRFFRPTRPLRQEMDFRPSVMKKYGEVSVRRESAGKSPVSFAFFGDRDHYRKWRVVDVKDWFSNFGSYCTYPGTHFMENEFVFSLLIPKIESVLLQK